MPRIANAETIAEFNRETLERLRLAYEAEVTSGKGPGDTFMFEGHEYTLAYAKCTIAFLDEKLPPARHWLAVSDPPTVCDIMSEPITDEFYDARLAAGTVWANMCPTCWKRFGTGVLGQGFGQRYRKRADGVFVKIEG